MPPQTRVTLILNALHSHPLNWSTKTNNPERPFDPDPNLLKWRPSRWIQLKPGPDPVLEREYLMVPSKGTYILWSDGARVCPGMLNVRDQVMLVTGNQPPGVKC